MPARIPVTAFSAAVTLILAFGGAVAGVSSSAPSISRTPLSQLIKGPHPDRQIEMLSRKIGQMLIVGFPGTLPAQEWPSRVAAMIGAGQIGGIILFADNVQNPTQLGKLTAALIKAGGGLPPFVAVDQEGGSIQRLTRRKGFQPLPSARTMARKPLCEAGALYLKTAEELAAAHINVNLGPVVDLDVNPTSPAIGAKGRSYNRDPETVVAYAREFIEAHDAEGVLTMAKHFPGHGSAARDPHTTIVDVTQSWQAAELQPFAELIAENRLPMVMVGHLIHPLFSDGDRPTSLSRRAITEELRGKLGFKGLVVTDDLGMGAIAERYSAEDAAVMAVRAGADLLIFANQPRDDPASVERIVSAVAGAVATGSIPETMIETSYDRIRAARQALADPHSEPAAPAPCPAPGTISIQGSDRAAIEAPAARTIQ